MRLDDLAWFDEKDRPRRSRLRQDDRVSLRSGMRRRLASPDYQQALSSNKPQCIVKVASFAKGVRTRALIEYVTRAGEKDAAGNDRELEFMDQDGGIRKGKEEVQRLYDEWRTDFERKRPGAKGEPRHATHIILSADTDNSEEAAAKVQFAANDFLDEFLHDQGYEYIFVTHRDTEKPHVHIVVKNFNRVSGRKFHLSKEATFHMRAKWAEALERRGVEAVATLRRDRVDVLENVAAGIEDIQKKETWNDRIMLRSSALTEADRRHLVARVDLLQRRIPGRADMQLQNLRSVLLTGTRKQIGRTIGTIQNSVGREIPEIRAELLEWVDGNRVPDMTFRQRKAMAKKVARMREDVKAATRPLSAERREYMSSLRVLDAAIRSKSRRDVERSADAVLAKAGKDIASVRRHLSRSFVPLATGGAGGRAGAKATAFHLAAADRQVTALMRELRDAAETVRVAPVSAAERKQVAGRLRAQFDSARALQEVLRDPRKLRRALETSRGRQTRSRSRERGDPDG